MNGFYREGEYWTLVFNGEVARLRASADRSAKQSLYSPTEGSLASCRVHIFQFGARRYAPSVAFEEGLAERVRALPADDADARERKMFGGLCSCVVATWPAGLSATS